MKEGRSTRDLCEIREPGHAKSKSWCRATRPPLGSGRHPRAGTTRWRRRRRKLFPIERAVSAMPWEVFASRSSNIRRETSLPPRVREAPRAGPGTLLRAGVKGARQSDVPTMRAPGQSPLAVDALQIFRRARCERYQPRVDSFRGRLGEQPLIGRQGGERFLRGLSKRAQPIPFVRLERSRPQQRRQFARRHPPAQVQLEETVLPLNESEAILRTSLFS